MTDGDFDLEREQKTKKHVQRQIVHQMADLHERDRLSPALWALVRLGQLFVNRLNAGRRKKKKRKEM